MRENAYNYCDHLFFLKKIIKNYFVAGKERKAQDLILSCIA